MDGKVIKNLDKHEGSITSVSFNPDGKLIASGSEDRTLKLWNLQGKVVQNFRHPKTVDNITFSSNGETIASVYQSSSMWSDVTSFTNLWRFDGTLIKTIESQFNNSNTNIKFTVQKIKFSSDGKTIAIVSVPLTFEEENSIYVNMIEINTENSRNFILEGHKNIPADISFSPE